MKKTIVLITILLFSMFSLTACTKSIDKEKALEFKNDYEQLNGKTNKSGKEHRTVMVNEENPYVKTTAEEIVKKIENKETFFVYFGDKLCPWCRSVIEKSIEVANKNKITTIYYVPVWDDEGNEILRDKFIINNEGTLEKTIEGKESYYKLLDVFKDFLKDYKVTNDTLSLDTSEKRIFAPNFVYVEKGEAKRFTTGISDKQTDSRGELTKEILKDEENQFEDFFLGTVCQNEGGC